MLPVGCKYKCNTAKVSATVAFNLAKLAKSVAFTLSIEAKRLLFNQKIFNSDPNLGMLTLDLCAEIEKLNATP